MLIIPRSVGMWGFYTFCHPVNRMSRMLTPGTAGLASSQECDAIYNWWLR